MRVSERGQITIPKELRDRLGIRKNTEVELVERDGCICIQKRIRGKHPVDELYGTLKLRYAGSVDEYIEEIRGR